MNYPMQKNRDRSAEQGFGLDFVAIVCVVFLGLAAIAGMMSNTAKADTVAFNSNLYYGITNNSDVQALQEFLTVQGDYAGPITGNFYSLTLAGVKNYQATYHLPITGYFGVLSRGVANSILTTAIVTPPQSEVSTSTLPIVTQGISQTPLGTTTTKSLCPVFTTPSGAVIDCNGNVLSSITQQVPAPVVAPQIQGVPQDVVVPTPTSTPPTPTNTPVVTPLKTAPCNLSATGNAGLTTLTWSMLMTATGTIEAMYQDGTSQSFTLPSYHGSMSVQQPQKNASYELFEYANDPAYVALNDNCTISNINYTGQ